MKTSSGRRHPVNLAAMESRVHGLASQQTISRAADRKDKVTLDEDMLAAVLG